MSYNYYRPSMFGGFSFFPPVVKGLLITNAAVFLLTEFLGSLRLDGISLQYFIYRYFALLPLGDGFLPWQLLTYQFMHGGFWHLFFNMFFGLWMFGMEVEHMWGARKFLIFYLSCGVVAGLAQLILSPLFESPLMGPVPTVGASGAVYGVLVAFGMMFPDRYIFLYFLIPVKVKYFVMFLIALGVLSIGDPTNVAHLAHLGGALAGYLFVQYDRRHLPLGGLFSKIRWWWRSITTDTGARKDDSDEATILDFTDYKEENKEGPDDQKRIDEILDKISRAGYQSLTEEEKKVLFEASRKLN
ncbi:MAG: rhomboid family intramembrane serine protease [Ignavibacterium sp.]|jgi:membrane associated rhomboid family serine protease